MISFGASRGVVDLREMTERIGLKKRVKDVFYAWLDAGFDPDEFKFFVSNLFDDRRCLKVVEEGSFAGDCKTGKIESSALNNPSLATKNHPVTGKTTQDEAKELLFNNLKQKQEKGGKK